MRTQCFALLAKTEGDAWPSKTCLRFQLFITDRSKAVFLLRSFLYMYVVMSVCILFLQYGHLNNTCLLCFPFISVL